MVKFIKNRPSLFRGSTTRFSIRNRKKSTKSISIKSQPSQASSISTPESSVVPSTTSSYKQSERSRGTGNSTAQLQYMKSFLNSLQHDIQTKTSMIQEDPEAFLFKVQDDIESSISKQMKSLRVKEGMDIMEKEVQPRAEAKVFNQFATVADAVVELVESLSVKAEETMEPDDSAETDDDSTEEKTVTVDELENKSIVSSKDAEIASGGLEDALSADSFGGASEDENFSDNLVALADSCLSAEWSVEDTVWTSRSVNFNALVEEEVTTNAKNKKMDLPIVAEPVAEDTPEVEDRNDVVDANDMKVTRQDSRAWDEESIEKEEEQQIRQLTVAEDLARTPVCSVDISDASSWDSETVATVESGWNFGKTYCWVVE